jgi:hypothetical protein
MNITFEVCDSKDLCISSNPINIGVEEQKVPAGEEEEDSEGYILNVPFLGKTEVSMDSITGIVGSVLFGVGTILIAVIKIRRSRSGKKRVSKLVREIRTAKNETVLENMLEEATRLYTKDRINTEDYSLIDGHVEKRRAALIRSSAAPLIAPVDSTPPTTAKGVTREDGYEWLEHPAGEGIWWHRSPGTESWNKWQDKT